MISFSDTYHFVIGIQSKSLPNEVMDCFGHTLNAPAASAFNQQRQKMHKKTPLAHPEVYIILPRDTGIDYLDEANP